MNNTAGLIFFNQPLARLSYVVEARNPLGRSATMVLTKEEKYAKLADSLGAEVVPAVIETFGAISDPLIGLFKDISSTRRLSRTLYNLP